MIFPCDMTCLICTSKGDGERCAQTITRLSMHARVCVSARPKEISLRAPSDGAISAPDVPPARRCADNVHFDMLYTTQKERFWFGIAPLPNACVNGIIIHRKIGEIASSYGVMACVCVSCLVFVSDGRARGLIQYAHRTGPSRATIATCCTHTHTCIMLPLRAAAIRRSVSRHHPFIIDSERMHYNLY